MDRPTWRADAIETMRATFAEDPRVIVLGVFGSLADDRIVVDRWSDVDLLVVVEDADIAAFHGTLGWLAVIGEVFVVRRHVDDARTLIMVVFADFRKMDVVFVGRSAVGRHLVPPRDLRVLIARDEALTARLRDPGDRVVPDTPSPLPGMIETFWFEAFTAVTKVMRNDLLIGLHLALELQRMHLVLAMLLRDRDLGTTIHRVGGVRNDLIGQTWGERPVTTRREMLALIERCGVAFDRLAADLDPGVFQGSAAFRPLIERARAELETIGE